MISKSKWIIASVFLSTLILEPAFAVESMRCGTHIISTSARNGPGKYEVLKKCGEPSERVGNTWIYERSGRAVVFDATGNVMRID